MSVSSREELRELVLSWRIKDAVMLGLGDGRVLRMMIDLTKEEDANTRIRGLLALYEVLKRGDEGIKLFVLKNGFNYLLSLLKSDDPRIVAKALKALSALTEGFPLSEGEFLSLLDSLVVVVKELKEITPLEVWELVTKLTVDDPSPGIRSRIDWLLSQEDPRLRGMGLRLMLNVFIPEGDARDFEVFLGGILELLRSDDDIVVDFALDTLSEALQRGIPADTVSILPGVLSEIKELIRKSDDFFLKLKAREVARMVEGTLSSHPLPLREDSVNSPGDKTTGVTVTKDNPATGRENGQSEEAPLTIEGIIEKGTPRALLKALVSRPDSVVEVGYLLRFGNVVKRLNALWALSRIVDEMGREELRLIHPLIPDLFDVTFSADPWERNRGGKILAALASRGGRRDITERMLSELEERPLPALEFFGYYFMNGRDEKVLIRFLEFIREALTEPEIQFFALMALDTVTDENTGPDIEGTFLPLLKDLLGSDDEGVRRIASRIIKKLKTT
ncbi:hypothetical protein [Thermococcus celer]|nr:hypothetical protein [Thermococcus celer]